MVRIREERRESPLAERVWTLTVEAIDSRARPRTFRDPARFVDFLLREGGVSGWLLVREGEGDDGA